MREGGADEETSSDLGISTLGTSAEECSCVVVWLVDSSASSAWHFRSSERYKIFLWGPLHGAELMLGKRPPGFKISLQDLQDW
jgi:hypothetical protein